VNENSEGQEAQVAVAPARARRVRRRDRFDDLEYVVFGVILASRPPS
jgi:hypothetical protein